MCNIMHVVAVCIAVPPLQRYPTGICRLPFRQQQLQEDESCAKLVTMCLLGFLELTQICVPIWQRCSAESSRKGSVPLRTTSELPCMQSAQPFSVQGARPTSESQLHATCILHATCPCSVMRTSLAGLQAVSVSGMIDWLRAWQKLRAAQVLHLSPDPAGPPCCTGCPCPRLLHGGGLLRLLDRPDMVAVT